MPSLRRYIPTELCDGAQLAILATSLVPAFPASRLQHLSDLHLKFALSHSMCGSMADIQSGTAEIRRGKKIDREKEKETTGQKYNGLLST